MTEPTPDADETPDVAPDETPAAEMDEWVTWADAVRRPRPGVYVLAFTGADATARAEQAFTTADQRGWLVSGFAVTADETRFRITHPNPNPTPDAQEG